MNNSTLKCHDFIRLNVRFNSFGMLSFTNINDCYLPEIGYTSTKKSQFAQFCTFNGKFLNLTAKIEKPYKK